MSSSYINQKEPSIPLPYLLESNCCPWWLIWIISINCRIYASSCYCAALQDRTSPKTVVLPCGRPVVSVCCGAKHSAAITDEGCLYTWGWGGSFWSGSGALGSGTTQSFSEPQLVKQVRYINTGTTIRLILLLHVPMSSLQFLEMGQQVLQVSCGSQHTTVLTSIQNDNVICVLIIHILIFEWSDDGRLFSTGKGEMGRLGLGSNRDRPNFEVSIEYII